MTRKQKEKHLILEKKPLCISSIFFFNQGKNVRKMSLGFTFALLLTLQSLHLVSSQTSNPRNGGFTPPPHSGIPDEWKRENVLSTPEEDLGISSGSMTFSGDDDYLAGNQTVIPEKRQNVDNMNTTPSPQTTPIINSDPTKFIATSIQQHDMSNLVTLNPNLGPSTTNASYVDLTETNTTTPSSRNSTTTTTNVTTSTTSAPAFNITQNSTLSYTNSPPDNSTNTTVFTTTVLNYTSVVLPNESSTASTTIRNGTAGSLDVRGNIDKGKNGSPIVHTTDSVLQNVKSSIFHPNVFLSHALNSIHY